MLAQPPSKPYWHKNPPRGKAIMFPLNEPYLIYDLFIKFFLKWIIHLSMTRH